MHDSLDEYLVLILLRNNCLLTSLAFTRVVWLPFKICNQMKACVQACESFNKMFLSHTRRIVYEALTIFCQEHTTYYPIDFMFVLSHRILHLYSRPPACKTSIIENTFPSTPLPILVAKNLTASAVPSAYTVRPSTLCFNSN